MNNTEKETVVFVWTPYVGYPWIAKADRTVVEETNLGRIRGILVTECGEIDKKRSESRFWRPSITETLESRALT